MRHAGGTSGGTPGDVRLWGGRFSGDPGAILTRINASIDIDKHLYAEDLEGSRAHCRMLAKQNILTEDEASKILAGLELVKHDLETGTLAFRPELEDIHTHIEKALIEKIGPLGGKLHTGRSRNDQVVTAFRLWLRKAIFRQTALGQGLIAALLARAEELADCPMPGYTHLQPAQPVTMGFHLLAYAEMSFRDLERLSACGRRVNASPLGSAALAGSSFPLDRAYAATLLGFDSVMGNAMDAVSSRDFCLEYLGVSVLQSLHLSRLAEEMVLWCSPAFGFIAFSDAYATGSSIMPQKRNPDAAELVRAKSGRVLGNFTGLATVLKALPMAYAKDLQEDKRFVFEVYEDMHLQLEAMTGLIQDFTACPAAMRRALGAGFITATELADWLVRHLGLPFREAHALTGALVQEAEKRQCQLHELPLAEMRRFHPGLTEKVYDVLDPERAIDAKQVYGGTAPAEVRAAVQRLRTRLHAWPPGEKSVEEAVSDNPDAAGA